MAIHADTHLLLRPVVHDFHLAVADGAGWTRRKLATPRGGWRCHYAGQCKDDALRIQPQKEG